MTSAIELQVISRILTTDNPAEIDELCEFSENFYSIFRPHIRFILDHREKYGNVPDPYTFLARFRDIELIKVSEPLSFIKDEMKRNRQRILLTETFNEIKDMTTDDPMDAWRYIQIQCDAATSLTASAPMDIVHDVDIRAKQVQDFAKQQRIPTGFPELDRLMYGGLSVVEELALFFGRTNTGKSWVASRMMETAQKNGFPTLYYSPEMQASFLGTRFDTWREHFKNSSLYQGLYDDAYYAYMTRLKAEETGAYILEDKDAPDGEVTVSYLKSMVKKLGIKELIIDGLSYMIDERGKRGDSDHIKYKNLCADLFRLSKQCGCAVAVFMQANRESKENKDDKGEIFPNIYNIEGSDHPARIATVAAALRQIFDKHILDIRLEKGRSIRNDKPVLSYMWDINNGNMQYVESADAGPTNSVTPVINPEIAGGAPILQQEEQSAPVEDVIGEELDF